MQQKNWKKNYIKLALIGGVVSIGAVAALANAEGWLGGWFGTKPQTAAQPVVTQAAVPLPDLGPLPTSTAEALQLQPNDRVQGRFGAPVTVIEYASLTCSHCADFKLQTFPQFKREWLDTGKATFVLRELPWDNLALGMATVARCVPPEQYYPVVEALFTAQKRIVTGNPLAEVKTTVAPAGLTGEQVEACIANADLQAQVLRNKEIARTVLNVQGTPAFFINGTPVEGAVDYKKLNETLQAAYAQTQPKP